MADKISGSVPTAAEFADMRAALVNQLPADSGVNVDSWWRRVRVARRAADADALRLLYKEAEHRLTHARRKQLLAVLRTLFRLLGIKLP